MRILGIDFGSARLGVALSDPTGTLATPLGAIHEKDKGQQIERVIALGREHDVTRFVVGIPFEMNGATGSMAETAEKFAAKLERVSGLPVARVDERLTSVEARDIIRTNPSRRRKKRMQRHVKGDVDAVAAAIILQDYLDSRPPRTGGDD